jgi:hypothetical protein
MLEPGEQRGFREGEHPIDSTGIPDEGMSRRKEPPTCLTTLPLTARPSFVSFPGPRAYDAFCEFAKAREAGEGAA